MTKDERPTWVVHPVSLVKKEGLLSEINNPHDLFFREMFSRPEVAREFLQLYLPPGLTAVLDLEDMELQKDSFIDPALQEHLSDLLYLIGSPDNKQKYVYLLFEHKSFQDSAIAFQFLRVTTKTRRVLPAGS